MYDDGNEIQEEKRRKLVEPTAGTGNATGADNEGANPDESPQGNCNSIITYQKARPTEGNFNTTPGTHGGCSCSKHESANPG